MENVGVASWVFTERAGRSRIILDAYAGSKPACTALATNWGGKVHAIAQKKWLAVRPTPPTRVGTRLAIAHDHKAGAPDAKSGRLSLIIPHGLAFGSGEHGTTFMLLRALAKRDDLRRASVLDLGTGSGVLALAARLFGAERIVATDFDPDAVRIARENELLNFPHAQVRWKCADVRKLKDGKKYDLVLANIFSGILIEAAPQISRCVALGGELWLSGILVSQEREVSAAYRHEKLKPVETRRRGKWVMLRLARKART